MAYVYRHIRLDSGLPFYIGIGNDNKYKYSRAYFKSNRSDYWKRIVNKHGYEVEILIDDISWDDACNKESEFIKLYGREDLGTGILINKTDGGEGCVNGITKETRQKMAAKLRGRPLPEWVKNKLSNAAMGKSVYWCEKPIYQFDLYGNLLNEYKSITEVNNKLNISNLDKHLSGERKHCGGYIFEYKDADFNIVVNRVKSKLKNKIVFRGRPVMDSSGRVFNTAKEACKEFGYNYSKAKWALYKHGEYFNIKKL